MSAPPAAQSSPMPSSTLGRSSTDTLANATLASGNAPEGTGGFRLLERIVLEREDVIRPKATENVASNVQITPNKDRRELPVSCSHDDYVRPAAPCEPGWQATIDSKPTEILVADQGQRR